MSTTATAGLSNSARSGSDLGFKDALVIGGSVLAVLIVLAVSKVALFSVLDLWCDLDGGNLRRWVAERLRKLFPFWNVRTQPGGSDTERDGSSSSQRRRDQRDVEMGRRTSPTGSVVTEELLLERLQCHVLTEQDVEKWRNDGDKPERAQKEDEEEESASDGEFCFPCSICLNEMKAGGTVFVSNDCDHTFHFDCLVNWAVSSSKRDAIECPNCRTQITYSSAGDDGG